MVDRSNATNAAVLCRAREIFLAGGKNASVLAALKVAAAQLGWPGEQYELYQMLRAAARMRCDGVDWRIKMLDRAIERAIL